METFQVKEDETNVAEDTKSHTVEDYEIVDRNVESRINEVCLKTEFQELIGNIKEEAEELDDQETIPNEMPIENIVFKEEIFSFCDIPAPECQLEEEDKLSTIAYTTDLRQVSPNPGPSSDLNPLNSFSCMCGKSFSRLKYLKAHKVTHMTEKPFSCTVCAKSFSRKAHLIAHMNFHTGVKNFCCTVCGKSLSRKDLLKTHMDTHTGDKRVPCSVCGKSLSRKDNLKDHMSIHTGQKSFSCSVCGKSFVTNAKLNIHRNIHTGERRFSCSICGKSLSRKDHLVSHMKMHNGDEFFL